MRQPIIILGMHRSGTTLITKLLETLGLFVGERKENNNEATFFLDLNDWLCHLGGATWFYPKAPPATAIISQHKEITDFLEWQMGSLSRLSFLGIKNGLHIKNIHSLTSPWGWKDPRNTFTLPFWTVLFPEAKIIHVFRHGVDVANSLKLRHEKLMQRDLVLMKKLGYLYRILPKRHKYALNFRCSNLEGCFSLWEEYISQARCHVDAFQERAIEVKYEDFLEYPKENLFNLGEFCELDVSEKSIEESVGLVKKTRAYAFLENPYLVEFSKQKKEQLAFYGY